jgi:UDP-GlcNAc:undecaprenyl-phosphate GlcNAc-1-phosphate transferase
VRALPLICSTLVALAIAPQARRTLAASPLAQDNYRGARIAAPLGLLIIAAALLSLAPLALVQHFAHRIVLRRGYALVATFVLGVALLGLADDALRTEPRGLRGHLAARAGTGWLKAGGTLGLALALMAFVPGGTARFLLGAAVLVLSTHVFNLVDVRPGRAVKLLAIVIAAVAIASGRLAPLWAVGLFAGPALVAGWLDLREQGMLGDTGSGLLGALAGILLVATLSPAGLAIALGVLIAIALYGEFRSISEFVERAPLLRHLDWLGRPHDALEH